VALSAVDLGVAVWLLGLGFCALDRLPGRRALLSVSGQRTEAAENGSTR
jgi:hypothetical protein